MWGEVGEVAAIRRRQLLTIAVQLCILKFVECALPNSEYTGRTADGKFAISRVTSP